MTRGQRGDEAKGEKRVDLEKRDQESGHSELEGAKKRKGGDTM